MEEVERLADHIVVMDHGKVIADETPAALYLRLPTAAALHVELEGVIPAATLQLLQARPDVAAVAAVARQLEIALRRNADALSVLEWLNAQGLRPLSFSTTQTRLEEVFLTLTGRSLRD